MANRGRMISLSVLVPLIIGLTGLFSAMERPRFQSFHAVDVLQLVASGACFGVALAALFAVLRRARAQ
jgi:hypothetical protein